MSVHAVSIRLLPLRRALPRPGWRRELAVFGAVYGLYMIARWVLIADHATAVRNAARVVHLEAALGIGWEAAVHGALGAGAVGTVLSVVYLLAQPVVIPLALVWVYRNDRAVYRVLRDTVLAAWLIALPIYALLPTAPPRLAGLGIGDSVTALTPIELSASSSTAFFNPYAAIPSLHAGFALAVGVAVAWVLGGRIAKAAALLWGPLVVLTTFATGNHFIVDAIAGAAVTAAGLGVAVALRARRARREGAAEVPFRAAARDRRTEHLAVGC
jgi:hypothetical protein